MLFNLFKQAEHEISSLDTLLINAHETVTNLQYGEHKRRKSGLGEDFRQFRPYSPEQDRPQDIDWRQSAKNDQIFVREKELQTSQDNIFWLDKNEGMDFKSDAAPHSKRTFAQILSMALALVLTQSHEKVGYAGSNKKGHSQAALENLGLALLNDPTPDHFSVRKNSTLFMIGDFLNTPETLEEHLGLYKQNSNTILCLQILDPAELDLPYDGRTIFEPSTGASDKHEIQNVQDIRNAYKTRIETHCETINTTCKQQGAFYKRILTTDNIAQSLQTIIEELSHA